MLERVASCSYLWTPSLVCQGEETYPDNPKNLLHPTSTTQRDASFCTKIQRVGKEFWWSAKNFNSCIWPLSLM